MSKSSNWGPCLDCKWWQIEPDASVHSNTMGQCIDEQLIPFLLRVSGSSGCDRFMQGKPARAKGASEQPPSAEPSR